MCALLLLALGVAVLVGWLTGNQVLISVVPGRASMKANAAVCFVLAGLALLRMPGRRMSHPWLRIVLACLLGLLAGATCAEYLWHTDLHLDQLLFADRVQRIFSGRMARISSANFTLAAVCVLLAGRGRFASTVNSVLALLILLSSYASIVGFAFGTPVFYGDSGLFGYTSMALHTGLGMLVLGAGLLASDPDSALVRLATAGERGSWLARRLMPVTILLPVLLGWLYLIPANDFGGARFGMALLAVTLAFAGMVAIAAVAVYANRAERQRGAVDAVRAESTRLLAERDREFELITDSLPTLISYISLDGRFIRVNRTYETWLGRPASEIEGCTVREVLGETYWAASMEPRARAAAGELTVFEADYPTQHGPRRTQIIWSPDKDERGRVRGYACMALDVEEQRRAESALRQSEKLAVVGRLASSIAHEINNPLEAVTNLLYLVEMDAPAGTELAAYVTQAQAELGRVTHIVTQTLRFHRQSSQAVLCTVDDLLEPVLTLHRGRLMDIAVERCDREPPAFEARAGEIRQVLANLVGNAADAMGGHGRLRIRAHGARHPHDGRPGISILVGDTGSGIGPVARGRLFEPFHTTKGETGSGLGLWVSKEIVERHGGTLRFHSRVDAGVSGTVFRLWLPLVHPVAAPG